MIAVKRSLHNPILMPNKDNDWEAYATLNASVIKKNNLYHMFYRAISNHRVSSIGYGQSSDGLHFHSRVQLITPDYDWERYGCEDPRANYIDGQYIIFYTAIATNPPSPEGIRVGIALSRNLDEIAEKHLVTPFNAKAMTLFPEKVNGKYLGILTANTDNPPAKIALVQFDSLENLWDRKFWLNWYSHVSRYTLPLQRRSQDHVEVGLTPIKTPQGWLLIYAYIQNYFSHHKIFGIEAALLDLSQPLNVMGQTNGPFLTPEDYPEKYGTIPNIVFPSGGVVESDTLKLYYGASDTSVCLAELSLSELTQAILTHQPLLKIESVHSALHLVRYEGNPLLTPLNSHPWEEKAILNAGIFTHNQTTYILYRALNSDFVSTLGLATTTDGYHIQMRLSEPVYTPRAQFEQNPAGGASGCEDPRLTLINDTLHMLYTGYNGSVARVVHTTISLVDFLAQKWSWEAPAVLSEPSNMDKNSVLFPQKVNNKYIILHRPDNSIWIDFLESFQELGNKKWLGGRVLCSPRPNMWDSDKIGAGGPPLKTSLGWLLIYHGISKTDQKYRLGLLLLDFSDPTKILLRLDNPLFEPKLHYENTGIRPGAVFTCGQALINDKLFVYYGAGDLTFCVAQIQYSYLLSELQKLL